MTACILLFLPSYCASLPCQTGGFYIGVHHSHLLWSNDIYVTVHKDYVMVWDTWLWCSISPGLLVDYKSSIRVFSLVGSRCMWVRLLSSSAVNTISMWMCGPAVWDSEMLTAVKVLELHFKMKSHCKRASQCINDRDVSYVYSIYTTSLNLTRNTII